LDPQLVRNGSARQQHGHDHEYANIGLVAAVGQISGNSFANALPNILQKSAQANAITKSPRVVKWKKKDAAHLAEEYLSQQQFILALSNLHTVPPWLAEHGASSVLNNSSSACADFKNKRCRNIRLQHHSSQDDTNQERST
jgi:hypothetical protein